MCDDNGGQGCYVCALCSDRVRASKAAKNHALGEKDAMLDEKDSVIGSLQAQLEEMRRIVKRQQLQMNDILGIAHCDFLFPGRSGFRSPPLLHEPSIYHGSTAQFLTPETYNSTYRQRSVIGTPRPFDLFRTVSA